MCVAKVEGVVPLGIRSVKCFLIEAEMSREWREKKIGEDPPLNQTEAKCRICEAGVQQTIDNGLRSSLHVCMYVCMYVCVCI